MEFDRQRSFVVQPTPSVYWDKQADSAVRETAAAQMRCQGRYEARQQRIQSTTKPLLAREPDTRFNSHRNSRKLHDR